MNKKIIFFIAVPLALIILIVAILLITRNRDEVVIPDELPNAAIIPWNPGGMADLVGRALLIETIPNISLENVHGANGGAGLNQVYDENHDGKTLLCTNLSSLVSLQQMGFSESAYTDWSISLLAFSPSIVAVANDSPYETLDDLISAAEHETLTCANSGSGTLGFVAAHLFEKNAGIEVKHNDRAGVNPALTAVIRGEADFIVAISAELTEKIRSGEIRPLAVLASQPLTLEGVEEKIPSAKEILVFGEYYGIMLPNDTDENLLRGYELLWIEAKKSESFKKLALEKGLITWDISEREVKRTADKIASLVCWTLYDTECINVSPDTLGIERD